MRQVSIVEDVNSAGIYTILIDNARFHDRFRDNIKDLLYHYLNDGEVFFGFCRSDGTNLKSNQYKELKNVIPDFFKKHGNLHVINEYLSAGRLDSCKYDIIPLIFDYYLETLLFNPKSAWESFLKYYSDYQSIRLEDIILNNYADILFYYFDSGDLEICFNIENYNLKEIKSIIYKIFG